MIKAVLFDFMETLGSAADGFRSAEKKVQQRICEQAGLQDRESFLEVYRRERQRFRDQACFSRRELWGAVYSALGRPAPVDQLASWEDEYWATVEADMRLFPETKTVLDGLSRRYRLGLISNQQRQGSSRGLSFPAFAEVSSYFPMVVIGGEGGIPPKPALAIFQESLRRIEVNPEEAVYVGDDWDVDIRGARAAGIRPIWLRHASVRRNWPPGDGRAPIITDLRALSGLETLI